MTIYDTDERRIEAIECHVKHMSWVSRDDLFFLIKKGTETMKELTEEISQLKKKLRKTKCKL